MSPVDAFAAAPDLSEPAASDAGAPPDAAGGPSTGPARYPAAALHSPMTQGVVDRLSAVLASSTHRTDVFAKIGDSITVNNNFLKCFDGSDYQLNAEAGLEPTRAWFSKTPATGTASSFLRTSLAAQVGWSASAALAGTPSPLAQELAAIDPAFAVVMFGTNDQQATGLYNFEKNLRGVVDALLADGVVPVVSTIPPRGDGTANAIVPEMNAIVRAVAQYRQVPLVDYWQTMTGLPSQGLGSDGIHPNSEPTGKACWFTPSALQYGFNQRNRVTLQALDRARRFLLGGAASEPAALQPLEGAGNFVDPFVVDGLPFVDHQDTSRSTSSVADVYSCGTQDESGPEVVYLVNVTKPTRLRARVFTDTGVDVDVHWLSAPDPGQCVVRNDKTADLDVQSGSAWLAVDSYVSGGQALAGGYRLTIVELP